MLLVTVGRWVVVYPGEVVETIVVGLTDGSKVGPMDGSMVGTIVGL